jgi:homoserine kinase
MGFAIERPEEVLIVRKNSNNILRIIDNTCCKLPVDPLKNVATVSAASLLKAAESNQGFDFIFESKITPGSGIGSSAASCTAAVVGVNALLNDIFLKEDLLRFALEGEKMASGSIHADNVAPALLGGFILIRSYSPIDLINIRIPGNLYCTVVHPEIEIKTSESRKLIPSSFPLKTVLKQCGNAAALIAGLNTSDFELIGRSLDDLIAEPVRAGMIPGYKEIKSGVKKLGAVGANISGSGPSVFAFSDNAEKAQKIAAFMGKVFDNINIRNKVYISKVSDKGTRLE